MYCPEHKVLLSRFLSVWMYWRDVRRETIPLRVWLNPLNYEITVRTGYGGRRLTINREGKWIRSRLWRIKQSLSELAKEQGK